MLIKTLQNQTLNVELCDLYIKPFYEGDKIVRFSICTNERNHEIELGEYSEKRIAEHMLKLLELYRTCPMGGEILKEILLCQDMYLNAMYSFKKAQKVGEMR